MLKLPLDHIKRSVPDALIYLLQPLGVLGDSLRVTKLASRAPSIANSPPTHLLANPMCKFFS